MNALEKKPSVPLVVEIDESEEDDFYEFHPEQSNILFENKASIPQNLLLSVVECYRKLREYCKKCYYKNSDQVS